MAAKRLVLDANILARAVLGVRVRGLIEHYAADVALSVPESEIAEAQEHLPTIFLKRRLPTDQALGVFESVRDFLQELPLTFYVDREEQAKARLADPEDWLVLACALVLDCPIWTETSSVPPLPPGQAIGSRFIWARRRRLQHSCG